MKISLGISYFLEEISSLSHSIVFLYLHWWLRKAFLFLLAILWNSAFKWVYRSFSPLPFISHLFTAVCKASSDNHFAFLQFFFLWMVLIPASCTMSQTSVHSSSGTLSIRSNPLNLWGSLMAQLVKNLLAMQETWVQCLGWEDSLEKGKATFPLQYSGWRIP